MSVTTTVLFDHPQREIASLIQERLAACETAKIVTGFATPGGLAAIAGPIRERPGILSTFIVGAGTYPAFEALDGLIASGVSQSSLFIHLGHTAKTTGKNNPFARYRPMLHSKIYYFEMPDGTASAFIGSNNLTSYAMRGLNGEASVLLEGSMQDPAFAEIRSHISKAQIQARPYDTSLKSAYAYWFREYLAGLAEKTRDPRDFTNGRIILIFAESEEGSDPCAGDIIFFEIPHGITLLKTLKTEVHLFLFDTLPPNPLAALNQVASSKRRFSCIVSGIADKQGFTEVPANWKILDSAKPVLEEIPSGTLRPATPKNMQQVQAEVKRELKAPPKYLFENPINQWDPVYIPNDKNSLNPDYGKSASESKEAPSNQGVWHLVTGLRPRERNSKEKDKMLLDFVAPSSGSFILVSTGVVKANGKAEKDTQAKDNNQADLFEKK
jgi:hypothetical protein